MKRKDKVKKSGALELIMLRNAFYRDSYKRLLLALLFIVVVNVALVGTIAYRLVNPPQPQYFATNGQGRMINWHPLSDPVLPDNFVLQWAANATRKVFSLDFIHWREQLQGASSSFTPQGWKNFVASLKASNNLKTLTSLKMVSNAQVTGAPRITEKAIVDGRYAWKIQMPILVTYTNGKRIIPMPLIVTLIVIRMPVEQDPERIAINNFLPVPQNKDQATSAVAAPGGI